MNKSEFIIMISKPNNYRYIPSTNLKLSSSRAIGVDGHKLIRLSSKLINLIHCDLKGCRTGNLTLKCFG